MKKALAILFAIAVVLSLSAIAFADDFTQTQSSSTTQQTSTEVQTGQSRGMRGQPPVMNGQTSEGELPSDLPERPEMSGEAPEMNGQPFGMKGCGPRMGGHGEFGMRQFIDFDNMVEDGVITQETCDKIKAYMEENKPDNLPEMNGEAPAMGGRPPMMNSQTSEGEDAADLPEPPEMNGNAPALNGEAPEDLPELPEMTGEAPEDLPEPPEMTSEAPEFDGEDGMEYGLLKDLLEAEVITQAEYDALIAAMTK